jgi:hypothetical protein
MVTMMVYIFQENSSVYMVIMMVYILFRRISIPSLLPYKPRNSPEKYMPSLLPYKAKNSPVKHMPSLLPYKPMNSPEKNIYHHCYHINRGILLYGNNDGIYSFQENFSVYMVTMMVYILFRRIPWFIWKQ